MRVWWFHTEDAYSSCATVSDSPDTKAKCLIQESDIEKLKNQLNNNNKKQLDKSILKVKENERLSDINAKINSLQEETSLLQKDIEIIKDENKYFAKQIDIKNLRLASEKRLTALEQDSVVIVNDASSAQTPKVQTQNKLTSPVPSDNQPQSYAASSMSQSTKNKKNTKQNLLLIGDSVTKRMHPSSIAPKEQLHVTIRSTKSGTISTINEQIKDNKYEISKYSCVTIHAGIKDISEAVEPNDILRKYENTVELVKEKNPDVTIAFSSIDKKT